MKKITIILCIIFVYLLIFNNSCIFERKKSICMFPRVNTKKQFTFLESEPWLDVSYFKPDSNIIIHRGDLYVIQPVFNEILSVFLDSSIFYNKPYGFLLVIDGLIDEMDIINAEDIMALSAYWTKNDYDTAKVYLKMKGEKKFQEYKEDDTKFNELKNLYEDLYSDTYKPRLKNSVYSYLIVFDYDDKSKQLPESMKFCSKPEGEYVTKKYILDGKERELITLVQKSDTIQRFFLNLHRFKSFKKLITSIIKKEDIDNLPYFISYYIDDNITNYKVISSSDIKAATMYFIENEQLILKFFIRIDNEKYLQEIKELQSEVDYSKSADFELLYKTFFPNFNSNKSSIFEVRSFIYTGEIVTKRNNEFPKNYEKYIKSKKNK